jgi:hypothetical protein
VRRLRVQLTVLLALLGMLVLTWGSAIFQGARDAARSNASVQLTVDRVEELRRTATRLSRDTVAMETSRRAYLVTGDEGSRRAQARAEVRADQRVRRVRRLSRRWWELSAVADQAAGEYRAWVRAGRAELRSRAEGAGAAVRTALMMLAALALIAVWLRRAVGARPTPCARPRAGWPAATSRPRSS